MSVLGINNGWIDPVLQYQAYPIFAYNNTYKQLISKSQYTSYMVCYCDLNLSHAPPRL